MSEKALVELALNGIWQGLALVVVVAVGLRLVGSRLTAASRYIVWWATFLAIGVLPAAIAIYSNVAVRVREPTPVSMVESATHPILGTVASPLRIESVVEQAPSSRPDASPLLHGSIEAAARSDEDPSGMPALRISSRAAQVGFGVYLSGVFTYLLALAWALNRLERLRSSMRLFPLELREPVARLRAACALERAVRIGVSDAVTVPVTLGFREPVVLIPSAVVKAMDFRGLEQVIVHELAHVARRDDWAKLVQHVFASVFFFLPALSLAAKRLELERELACDDWVLARTGAARHAYARCLLRVGELATGGHGAPAGALSMASQLRKRVVTLLGPAAAVQNKGNAPLFFTFGGVFSIAALVAVMPGLRVQLRSDELPISVAADYRESAGDITGAAVAARTDAVLRRYEEYGLHGAVLVAYRGSVVLRAGYGHADRERAIPWSAETAFNGGAIAKMLTSAAILKLEEDGRLQVSHRVEKYLGAFPEPKNEATIHHLLTHSAGLAQPWAPVYRTSRDDFIHAMKATPIDYAPGQGHRYTDLGHALLAAVIEVASGMSYEAYVRSALLEPAGMLNTWFEGERPGAAPLAVEYNHAAGADSRTGRRDYVWGRRGAMGVITTVDDIWRWHRALDQGLILSGQTRARMLTGWVDAGRNTRIGYGWEVGLSDRGTRLRHRLSAWGANSVEVVFDEDEDLFIALVANAPTGWNRPKYTELLNAALARPHLLPQAPSHVDNSALTPLTGRYLTPAGDTIRVRSAGPAALRIDASGDGRISSLLGGSRARNTSVAVLARPLVGSAFGVLDWSRHQLVQLRFADDVGSLELSGGSVSLIAHRSRD